jgi:hypothetical protein
MTIRKITSLLLVFISAAIIWLFPAFVTPRHSQPFDGQDLMQYHQAEMAKEMRSQRITLWVCVPAGIALGTGLSLFVSGIRKKRQAE